MHTHESRPHIKKLLLRLTITLIVFIGLLSGVVLSLHKSAEILAENSHQTLLPQIHDHQRAALNLERLERMGDLVAYGGTVELIRKNALAAQVLAFQPSFNLNEEARDQVQNAFQLIREIRNTRQLLLQPDTLSPLELSNLKQLERTLQTRWGEYKHQLFSLQNSIITAATSLQEKNLTQITTTHRRILMVSGSGLLLLFVVLIFIGFNLYRHLIVPVTESSQALAALEQGQLTELTPARYEETNKIYQAVATLSQSMKKLHDMATRDALTRCQNRGYFMEQAQAALAAAHQQKRKLSLIMLDVDHFKHVNDHFGHAVGDDTLICLIRWIEEILPDRSFIGRLGGEEFALILPDHSSDQAFELAENIRIRIAERSSDSKVIPAITLSLGIDTLNAPTDEVDSLLTCADKALYQAKASGRNRTIIYHNTAQQPIYPKPFDPSSIKDHREVDAVEEIKAEAPSSL